MGFMLVMGVIGIYFIVIILTAIVAAITGVICLIFPKYKGMSDQDVTNMRVLSVYAIATGLAIWAGFEWGWDYGLATLFVAVFLGILPFSEDIDSGG